MTPVAHQPAAQGAADLVTRVSDAPWRMVLHGRAPGTVRRHLVRSLLRVTVLVAADISTLLLLLTAAVVIDLSGPWDAWVNGGVPLSPMSGSWWALALALVVGLAVAGAYGRGDSRRDGRRLLWGGIIAVGLNVWHLSWTQGPMLAVAVFLVLTVPLWMLLVLQRRAVDAAVRALRVNGPQIERVLFVGDASEPRAVEVFARLVNTGQMTPVGWVSVSDGDGAGNGGQYLGSAPDLSAILHRKDVDTVVLCGKLPDDKFRSLVKTSVVAGCHVLALSRYDELGILRPALVRYQGIPFVELTAPSLKARQLLVKRVVDVLGAAAGLALLLPAFALIAIAIKLDSRGPVFFRQERVGRGGNRFAVWKFRTMKNGCSDAPHRAYVTEMIAGSEAPGENGNGKPHSDGPVFKLVSDARVTAVGKLLRASSIDELPQLINVVRGEMSLVGPRPPLPYEVDRYEHWQFDRLGVLPGMTGLWQVSGRNLLSYKEMCELDIQYVERWSLWLDLKILLKTVPVVLFNSGRAA